VRPRPSRRLACPSRRCSPPRIFDEDHYAAGAKALTHVRALKTFEGARTLKI
jgi:hypothetical protein